MLKEMKKAFTILAGKLEGKKPRALPRYRWKYNIKMNHKEIGC
jgi:hypothetical protein